MFLNVYRIKISDLYLKISGHLVLQSQLFEDIQPELTYIAKQKTNKKTVSPYHRI